MQTNENTKKGKSSILRASLICFLIMTVICGLIYPLSVTLVGEAIFPYEANGSVIKVTDKEGNIKIYGSELIGQSYIKLDSNGNPVKYDSEDNYYVTNEEGVYFLDANKNYALDEYETTKLAEDKEVLVLYQTNYLIGRNNSGAPSNASPESPSYKETVSERTNALIGLGYNKEYNEKVGYNGIPDEMVTESGSGCDPEVTYDTAMYQVKMIAETRGMTEDEVKAIIDECTKGRFLGIFGPKRVNVLMVNLKLDGLI